ncbi:sodium/hydrogen exchanger 9B2-like [Clavelina lepadiformis]|uniref:sodium/hydrogen exchanger 9B2-like n=1 Tax=Clavelina lepadiformis TaxID=159417 RepID=UPI0040412C6B
MEVKIPSEKEQFCSCPPTGYFDNFFTYGLLVVLSWAVPWSVFGEDCLPGGNLFGLIILIDSCVLIGLLVSSIPLPKLPPLPPLLGMLLAGIALRNIPVINVASYIDTNWSATLRSVALTVILVKAGLELDAGALKKMKGVCLRLSALPCLVEAVTCAVACYLLLGFSWEWGFILGFVLGAVTPAVIVPSLLILQEKGLGIDQGIPTLVIAASSFDDVLAISGFSVVLGVAFSTVGSTEEVGLTNASVFTNISTNELMTTTSSTEGGDSNAGELALMIFRGPLEMLGGVAAGAIIGIILWYVPNGKQKHSTFNRTLLVFGVGILSIFGSRIAGFPGSGALAAIVAPFVAAFKWNETKVPVSNNMGVLWKIFEPIMFGLIGAEINIESMDADIIGLGLAVLFIGLLFRTLTTFAAVLRAGLTLKEKIFVCFAWLPKATVQAAIGPVALDTAKKLNAPEEIQNIAEQILTIAVLSILITAPLGAATIGLSGPVLLRKQQVVNEGTLPLNDQTAICRLVEQERRIPADDGSETIEL